MERLSQPLHNLSLGVVDVFVKFQIFILNAVRMHVEFTFFLVINPLFLTPRGYSRIVNPSTTCPEESDVSVKFELRSLKTVRMQ